MNKIMFIWALLFCFQIIGMNPQSATACCIITVETARCMTRSLDASNTEQAFEFSKNKNKKPKYCLCNPCTIAAIAIPCMLPTHSAALMTGALCSVVGLCNDYNHYEYKQHNFEMKKTKSNPKNFKNLLDKLS
jgi:hypothetical protein